MSGIFEHLLNRSLAHIVRFNSRPQHFQESVAEHSFYVAYITRILCDLLAEKGVSVDKEKAITMGLVHDLEEVFSGDILSPFKHHSEEVQDAIRKVNQVLIKEVFDGLPEPLAEHYITLWNEEGGQESIEAQVVKAADRLSLVAKCKEEIDAGNTFFEHIYARELGKLVNDKKEWWQKIKNDVLSKGAS